MTLSVPSALFYRSHKEHSRVSLSQSLFINLPSHSRGRSTDIIFAGVTLAHTTSSTERDQGVRVTRGGARFCKTRRAQADSFSSRLLASREFLFFVSFDKLRILSSESFQCVSAQSSISSRASRRTRQASFATFDDKSTSSKNAINYAIMYEENCRHASTSLYSNLHSILSHV